MPFFCEVRYHAAANQTVSGGRVSEKIVPAVEEIRFEQLVHIQRPSLVRQPPTAPQLGQTNPSGQRSQSR